MEAPLNLRVFAVAIMAAGLAFVGSANAQSQGKPEKLEFDVASVKQNKSDDPPNANFPLGRWAMTDRFDIQARAQGNPTKDQMRLMMRSLLADRFKLAIHYDTRDAPALAMVLVKPDKLTTANGLPTLCGGIFGMPSSVPGRVRAAARNVGLGLIATSMTVAADLGRPVVDRTGRSGTFDFSLEWAPASNAPKAPAEDLSTDESGPGFEQALKEQLGLKLESTKAPLEVFMVDHLERPSEN